MQKSIFFCGACIVLCLLPAMAQEEVARNSSATLEGGRAIGCENHTNIQPQRTDIFLVPGDLMARAKKKQRLIELLKESLHNDATAINDIKKDGGSRTDARVEEEIRKLANDLRK